MTKYLYIPLLLLLLVAVRSTGQQNFANRLQSAGGAYSGPGGPNGPGGKGGSKDSLKHRTGLEDSITINYRFLDSSRYKRFDSSINDFTKWYPIPADYFYLGNLGSAAKSLLFKPNMKAGWDAGFHAFDIYRFTVEGTRYFNTTRPYTELGYLLGSKNEQMVHVLHTQNINPNWNFAFQYRLLTAPGYFKNQNTAQNNFSISTFYQSPSRRYHLFLVLLNNNIRAAENGGIVNKGDLDNTVSFSDRATIPVYLGATSAGFANPFSTTVNTGNKYRIFNFMLRQQYDLGIKDSIVTDSSVIQLFYPKLRLEYTAQMNNYTYTFADNSVSFYNDTIFYRKFYNFISMPSNYQIQDKWNEVVNDFSIYQFPDSKNPQQFFKLGASLQNLKGIFDASTSNYYNTWVHGEYRNKTRNQKWDLEATGELHTTGLDAGDYSAYASLKRLVSRQIGYLQIGAQNISRTPSFIFNPTSSFNFGNTGNYKKENTLRLFAILDQPEHRLRLSGNYYLVTNYTYFSDYYHTKQASGLFNLLEVTADKEIHLTKHLIWISEITLQQKAGNAPINVPLVFTRQRIGYEGTLGFPNLRMSTGLEFRYNTPYKADGYSPLMGQFYYQDSSTVSLKVPTIDAYLHFRIRSFTAYVRLENLNTATTKNGFGFTNNNFAINGYPYPGMQIHVGIFWSFVN